MPLTEILLIVISLGALFGGAEALVRGSSSGARRLGMSPIVAGLTVVAYGTSTPEMVVSVTASLAGKTDIALGNVVGSNIFNIAIILGIAALIQPIKMHFRLVRLDIPIMIGVTALFVILAAVNQFNRPWGILLTMGVVSYTVFQVVLGRKEAAKMIEQEFDESVPPISKSIWLDCALIIIGITALSFGGDWLVKAASSLAAKLGVSEAVIGLTIVAAGTSAPELASSIVASLRGQNDIAVGNIVGSNIFNILGVAGVACLAHPLDSSGLQFVDYFYFSLLALLALPIAYSGFVIKRVEGAILLLIYGTYLFWLWPKS